MPRAPGLYDTPITESLRDDLNTIGDEMHIGVESLSDDIAPEMLARLLHDRLVLAFRSMPSNGTEKLTDQLALANQLLELLRERAPKSGAVPGDRVATPGHRLLSLVCREDPRLGSPQVPQRPEIPLGTSQLLVNGRRDLSVGPEICKELASADRVDHHRAASHASTKR